MKKTVHKADTRGYANHGWLDTHHTFSFANYYDPQRIHFGALRVLNDDVVAPGMGFGTHPHDNMEIVSIPLEGDLEHKDSMGNVSVIRKGEIQVMSAGTGITHSEYNKNGDQPVKFLQIWVFPDTEDVTPRYDQIKLDTDSMHNGFMRIVAPRDRKEEGAAWVHQNTWFSMSRMDADVELTYDMVSPGDGLYIFVLQGEIEVDGEKLGERDGIGVWDTESVTLKANKDSEVLFMEVPMM